jgi:hypothetical protein
MTATRSVLIFRWHGTKLCPDRYLCFASARMLLVLDLSDGAKAVNVLIELARIFLL